MEATVRIISRFVVLVLLLTGLAGLPLALFRSANKGALDLRALFFAMAAIVSALVLWMLADIHRRMTTGELENAEEKPESPPAKN